MDTKQSVNATAIRPSHLTFAGLRNANINRLPQFKNSKGELSHPKPDGSDWSPAQWLQAVTGELGEYANIRKKYERGDIKYDEFYFAASEELADVQTYLDLLAYRLGIDLGHATITKFNKVSERVGSDVRLGNEITVGHPKIVITQSAGICAVFDQLKRHNELGYTAEHDRTVNSYGELVAAAEAVISGSVHDLPNNWDKAVFEKIVNKKRVERLAIAASLLIAEINRIS